MATHRAIPGANLPESGTTSGRKGRIGGEAGEGRAAGLGNGMPGQPAMPGESGDVLPGQTSLGTGLGTGPDTFGTTAESDTTSARQYPRAVGVVDQVKRQASTRVNEQKERAAQGLGSVASAIRQASEHLRSENQTLATYADRAVDQIQLFADRMRDKEPEEMMRDLEQFARRNPTAFVGGAFLLGVGLARFLKSSGTTSEMRSRDLAHEDTDFGRRDVMSSPDYTGSIGRTAADGLARPDDLSRPSGGLTTDPTPGITS